MDSFPTIDRGLDVDSGFTTGWATDPVVRTTFDNGSFQSRKRFTSTLKTFKGAYRYVSSTDKATFETFFETTVDYGATEFYWTNPSNGKRYTVKFAELPVTELEDNNLNQWRISINLVEAYPKTETTI